MAAGFTAKIVCVCVCMCRLANILLLRVSHSSCSLYFLALACFFAGLV